MSGAPDFLWVAFGNGIGHLSGAGRGLWDVFKFPPEHHDHVARRPSGLSPLDAGADTTRPLEPWYIGWQVDRDKDAAVPDESLTLLGEKAPLPASPEEAQLERVQNPNPDSVYLVRFTCPEFTSLCPITGQPDFAHLVIDYVPAKWLVESKSLKLYLGSFRNHGAFHEDCTVNIARRLVDEIAPQWLRIGGYFFPRGGIPIDVFYQTAPPPEGLWLPDQGVAPYRGRG